jgi:hypothetical protein
MNLSLLVHTFNGYKHLWPGCLDSFAANFHENVPMYFGTDYELHTRWYFRNFKPIYSGPGEWSDRLRTLMLQIPSDYVLYMQEDHWPSQPPPILDKMMGIVIENDLLRLQISPIVPFYSLFSAENTLFFAENSKYLVSHQPSIWKKSFLLECLKPSETPWKNEYEGTKRLKNDPKIRKKIAIYPYNWYKHMCIKGKVVGG